MVPVEREETMIGPDQDLSQFPRWIWPYIRVELLARSRVFAAQERAELDTAPKEVVLGHFAAIVQAAHLKNIASRMTGEIGAQIAKAADAAISEELDDWCPTKPHPHPHRAGELATYLAALSASSTNERLRGELGSIIDQIASRSPQR